MKRSVNGTIAFLLVFILIFSTFTGCASSSGGGSAESAEGGGEVSVTDGSYYPVTFTDMGGNEVTIEKEPQKIAALMGGTYENIVWCDPAWADKIVASMSLGSSEWRDLMAPYREDMIQAGPSVNRDPNVEELAELGVDTVFYWSDLDDIRKQMEDLGMTVIECSSSTGAPTTPEDVIKNEVDTYRMYAVALNCVEKADAYEKYVTDMVNMVADRTSSLEEGEKPSMWNTAMPTE